MKLVQSTLCDDIAASPLAKRDSTDVSELTNLSNTTPTSIIDKMHHYKQNLFLVIKKQPWFSTENVPARGIRLESIGKQTAFLILNIINSVRIR